MVQNIPTLYQTALPSRINGNINSKDMTVIYGIIRITPGILSKCSSKLIISVNFRFFIYTAK